MKTFNVSTLPLSGRHVIEASAGTGKTYNITRIFLRLLLEKQHLGQALKVSQILVVTFTKAATQEIKNRIAETIHNYLYHADSQQDDFYQMLLQKFGPQSVTNYLQAIALELDESPILTIHAFCQKVIKETGFITGLDEDNEIVNSDNVFVLQALKDEFRREANTPQHCAMLQHLQLSDPLTFFDKFKGAFNSLNPVKFVPSEEHDEATNTALEYACCMIQSVKAEAQAAKQQARVLSQNDSIKCLHQALSNPLLAAWVRAKYPHALIDEFQDTDKFQYEIFDRIYPHNETNHFWAMIGDPKQAIYGFRDCDIYTYLRARNEAAGLWNMHTNYRSSARLIEGYNYLFQGVHPEAIAKHDKLTSRPVFGSEITYPWIESSTQNQASLSINQTVISPFQCLSVKSQGKHNAKHYRALVAQHCAQQVVEILSHGHINEKPVQAKDIAILVRSKNEAELIKEQLSLVRVPCVYLSDRENLLASDEAKQLYMCLQGIVQQQNSHLVHTALATELMGLDSETLRALRHDDNLYYDYYILLQSLLTVWQQEGILALVHHLIKHHFKHLGMEHQRERKLTNYTHIAEWLQQRAQRFHEPSALLHHLYEVLHYSSVEDETEMRLESDQKLVQIITMHGSKGLEYPIVMIPFNQYKLQTGQKQFTYKIFDRAEQEQQTVISAKPALRELESAQQAEEDIRLLYVAITRAKYACYLYLDADAYQLQKNDKPSAWQGLAQLVVGDNYGPSYAQQLSQAAPHLFNFQLIVPSLTEHVYSAQSKREALSTSTLTANIKQQWLLTSFSAINNNLPETRRSDKEYDEDDELMKFSVEPQEVFTDDNRFTFAKGPNPGNCLHKILEDIDFIDPDWCVVNDSLQTFSLTNESELLTKRWIAQCLQTPLPNLYGQQPFSLTQLNYTSKEPEFYLPLSERAISRVLSCLNQHRDGLQVSQSYALSLHSLQGLLHGYIDLLFMHEGRYYVCDYKSNFLGAQFTDYLPAKLAEKMTQANYDLQYLLYSLALHRLLKSRIKDYDIDTHFGGVYYLFLRGMHLDNLHHEGIYARKIEPALLSALDAAVEGSNND